MRGDASITPVLPLVACLHSNVPASGMSAQDVPVTLGLGEATGKALTRECAIGTGKSLGYLQLRFVLCNPQLLLQHGQALLGGKRPGKNQLADLGFSTGL